MSLCLIITDSRFDFSIFEITGGVFLLNSERTLLIDSVATLLTRPPESVKVIENYIKFQFCHLFLLAILGPTSMSITKETEGCGNIYAMYGKLKVVPDMF